MDIGDIRKSLFGYKQQDVCRYINELNEKHAKDLMEKSIEWEERCKNCKEHYLMLEKENMELKNKIDLIGDIIIKAEKYANEIIAQARMEAQSITQEALLKVEQEAQRLETAKKYIEQIRKDVNDALYKINDILDTSEKEIENHFSTLKR